MLSQWFGERGKMAKSLGICRMGEKESISGMEWEDVRRLRSFTEIVWGCGLV